MDFADARLTVGVPNDLQMERNLTGGLPVVYQGHLTSLGPFRERLTPAHEKKQEGCAGGGGSFEDIDLRVTRQEGPGYSYGHCQKPGAKLEDDGPEMGYDPDIA